MDSLARKQVYGFGPVEFLQGELLIWDGEVYQSTVVDAKNMRVSSGKDAGAPFFAYSLIPQWREVRLPGNARNLKDIETFLDTAFAALHTPFFFKLEGDIESANIHVVNLPEGKQVKNPDDAHQGQVNYSFGSESIRLLGFFSRNHQAIFTHHDTFVHAHLINRERDHMGHVEDIIFSAGKVRLWVPVGSGE